MAEDHRLLCGRWWRFSAYEVRDGYIRPAPGARLEEYDPFSEAQKDGTERPYESLMRLRLRVRFEVGRPPSLAHAEEELALTTWCSRHGLLGLLPQRTLTARLAPRWSPFMLGDSFLGPGQRRFIRTNTGWMSFVQVRFGEVPTSLRNQPVSSWPNAPTDEDEGRLVPKEYWNGLPPSGAVIVPLFSLKPEPKETSLADAWGRYFPDIPREEKETANYPLPLSADFWRGYAEPLLEFDSAVANFYRMMNDLRRAGPWDKLTEEDQRAVLDGRQKLHSLIHATSPALAWRDEGSFDAAWVSSSLLASFGLMVWQDLSGGKFVRMCQKSGCGNLFVTDQYNRHYCRPQCKQAEEKRRSRARRRETSPDSHSGETP